MTAFVRVALTALIVIVAAPAIEAAPPVRQVLLLQSIDHGSVVFDSIIDAFRGALEARSPEPVTVWQFVVAPAGFVDAPEEPALNFLQAAFANRARPDLVVTIGGTAAAFARKFRQRLFPTTPIVFAATEPRFLGDTPLGDNETAVTTVMDYVRLVDDILQVLPETAHLLVVTGAGPLGQFWRDHLEGDLQHFRDRLTFTWTDDLSYAEMLERAVRLPPHSAILFVTSGTDVEGGWRSADRTIDDLAARANAPLFGIQSAWLGSGIVGGTLMVNESLGALIADVALRVLRGEPAGAIRVPARTPGPAAFDARQLRRWKIAETRLPAGSVVRFRGPSLWRDYRREVLAALGLLIAQAIGIAGLLYERRARRRAEAESRRHLAIAADANRRSIVSALTGSIAHELSQPLGVIGFNAATADQLVTGNRATPEALHEMLTDISAESLRATQIIDRHQKMLRTRQIELQPLDVHRLVRESVALLGHEIDRRQMQLQLDVPSQPDVALADPVMLQQVLVNLVINAMDAMATTPTSRRRVFLTGQGTSDRIKVSVCDDGPGLPASLDGRLFEAFVTTKPNGLGIGLNIARTIVEAHGGRLDAQNNVDGGATFTITLPRHQVAVDSSLNEAAGARPPTR